MLILSGFRKTLKEEVVFDRIHLGNIKGSRRQDCLLPSPAGRRDALLLA